MRFLFLATVAVFACGLSPSFPQPLHTRGTTNWGPAVARVALSIGITNEVITRGSNLVLYARIRNCSTNVVAIGFAFEPVYDFEVKVVDLSGTEHEPIPRAPGRMGNANGAFRDIKPGDTFEMAIPIHCLNPALRPGKYSFKARQMLFPRHNGKLDMANRIELISNPLAVRVE